MPQCQFPIFCYFMCQKIYTGNILRIGRNKIRNSYFSRKKVEDRTRAGGGPEGRHTLGWRPPWRCRHMVRWLWSTSDDASSPIKSLPMENPKTIGKFPERVPQLRRHCRRISGGQKFLFRHPAGTRKCPRSHLHRSPSPSLPSPLTSPPSPSLLLPPMMRRE
jgi:hypothetical protein